MSRPDTLQTSVREPSVTIGKDMYKIHKKQVMAHLVNGESKGSPFSGSSNRVSIQELKAVAFMST